MFRSKDYKISKGKHGNIITLLGEMSQNIITVIKQKDVVELELNYAKGWKSNNDISFLKDMSFLKSLEILDWSISDISSIHYLTNVSDLKIITGCKTEIDFSVFSNLETVSLEWRPKAKSIYECSTLIDLFINKCTAKSISQFSSMANLKKLSLKSPKLIEIGNVETLQKLEFLGIYNSRTIDSLTGIEVLTNLKRLEIDTCKKVNSIESIKLLNNLRELWICNNGEIESLKPLGGLQLLEKVNFHESTNILDGNLKILIELPKLKSISFQERQHYNMKRCDFSMITE